MKSEQKLLMEKIYTLISESNLSYLDIYEVFNKIPNDNINRFIGYMKYERWNK